MTNIFLCWAWYVLGIRKINNFKNIINFEGKDIIENKSKITTGIQWRERTWRRKE